MTDTHPPHIETSELVGELVEACRWLADPAITPHDFRRAVVAFEARKHARFGYRLESAVARNGVVHFALRLATTDELCASLWDPLESTCRHASLSIL